MKSNYTDNTEKEDIDNIRYDSNGLSSIKSPRLKINCRCDGVKALQTNVRSLVKGTKRKELQNLIQLNDIAILGITESWGRPDISDSDFDFPGFDLIRKDRSVVSDKKGGGVALFIKTNLLSSPIEELNSMKCESVWAEVFVSNRYIIVGVCYRSPAADKKEIMKLFECIRMASSRDLPMVIMGDFNYPKINWSDLKGDLGHEFVTLVLDCHLEQTVHKPTRQYNILDLVLVNKIKVVNLEILPPVDNCDHNVLIWEMVDN